MINVRCSAPGKLYLLGEYAVLDGAPALLRGVDRRATVTMTESNPMPTAQWSLTAPQLGLNQLVLGANATLPDGLANELRERLELFDQVRSAVDTLASPARPCDITIESAQFVQDGHKLGLGSSAAVAVALTAALAASRHMTLTPSKLFALASAAHTAAQGGKGSGGDIATSVYGGHILFQKGSEPHSVKPQHVKPRQVNWPEQLELFAVVTGEGSSTVDLVSRVADYAARQPAQYRDDLTGLSALAARAEAALGSADTFLELADEYFHGIDVLDAHAHAGIVTDRHRELRKIAAESGAVFKTSGAGGGDLGLVFAKLDPTGHLSSVFTEAGAAVIPVPFSPDGVRMEPA